MEIIPGPLLLLFSQINKPIKHKKGQKKIAEVIFYLLKEIYLIKRKKNKRKFSNQAMSSKLPNTSLNTEESNLF